MFYLVVLLAGLNKVIGAKKSTYTRWKRAYTRLKNIWQKLQEGIMGNIKSKSPNIDNQYWDFYKKLRTQKGLKSYFK